MSVAAAVAVDETTEVTLNSLERLILAQAVYELGSDAWTNVSSILSQHPLILQVKRDTAIFSPSTCQNIYHDLLRIVGLDSAEPEKQPRNAHSNNLKLAQRMYQARVLELKQLILAEEARFNSVAAEIEAIRAGKWDVEIEKSLGVDETTPDRPSPSPSPQSERVSTIEVSGSDLTGVSDSSSSAPQLQADLPFPEEEMVQRQLDEDLAILESLPRDTTPPSTHEGDIEPSIAPKLSPVASPVGTDYVDEHIDLPGSPRLPHDSPDPLDIITPAEDDSEREPSPTHERSEAVQPPSPSQPFEGSDGAVSAEPEHSSIAEPPEIAEVHEDQLVEPSEVVEQSEAEVELESDGHAPISNSNPVDGETSTEDRSDGAWKDDASMRHISEPPLDHAVEPPPSFEDTTTSLTNTLKTDTPKTESEGTCGAFSSSEAESHLGEATGTVEVKEEIPLDESRPGEIEVKQGDEMDVEQKNVPKAASPVAEQSRRDHKRKVSEAASIFSDSVRDRKKTREDSQPIDEDEPGPARRRGRPPTADSQTSKKFQTVITMVHSQISQHRNGNIFHNPIKTSEAPDYYDIVKRPMDLKTIKSRIREGQITSSDEFQRDVYLMFANSLMYNRPGSDIFNMAEEMMLESEAQINTFRQTEGIIKGSHR